MSEPPHTQTVAEKPKRVTQAQTPGGGVLLDRDYTPPATAKHCLQAPDEEPAS